ncbi:hypothetical protein FEZ08_11550 [Culicoidibacter larvae]|uniref:Uncharacterized protein n=1 Tax=Culicoidibacter larvae TaxID=2579976 RepID=A0A5R8Q6Y4_9FIRM|nr:hypothetical protein FEZ08_11550 [Culicoidibacter larvae]
MKNLLDLFSGTGGDSFFMTEAIFIALITYGSAIVIAIVGEIGKIIMQKIKSTDHRKNHRGRPSKR